MEADRLVALDAGRKSLAVCSTQRIPGASVEVSYDAAGFVFVSGVGRCKCAFGCGFCSGAIARARAEVLTPQLSELAAAGYALRMVTFTTRHSICESGEVVLARLRARLDEFFEGSGARALGVRGVVGIDYTYGKNGHHWHYHAVFAIPPGVDPDALGEGYWTLWRDLHAAAGVDVSREAWFWESVEDGIAAAHYVLRALKETLSTATKEHGEGLTIYQLRRAVAAGNEGLARPLRQALACSKGLRAVRAFGGLSVKVRAGEAVARDGAVAARPSRDVPPVPIAVVIQDSLVAGLCAQQRRLSEVAAVGGSGAALAAIRAALGAPDRRRWLPVRLRGCVLYERRFGGA